MKQFCEDCGKAVTGAKLLSCVKKRHTVRVGKKGSAMAIWLTALASIFVLIILYVTFNAVFYSPYGLIMAVNSSLNQTNPADVNLTQPLATMNITQIMWNSWVLVGIFAVILWAFWKSVGGKEGEL